MIGIDKGVISMYISEESTHSKWIERPLIQNNKPWSQGGSVSVFTQHISATPENQRFLSRLYTSKEEFIAEYKKHQKSTGEEILFHQLVAELAKSLIDNDIDNFKKLSRFIDYIRSVEGQEALKDYYNNVNNPILNTNLVILACQYNQAEVLDYLFDKSSNILNNLSVDIGKNILLPSDEDETHHNAFYYAIRSGNIELLTTLIDKWPDNYFAVHFCELDEIISRVYEELYLKNVPLPEEMKYFIENKLVDLRFFSNASKQSRKAKGQHKNINERIELILHNVNLLKSEYSNAKIVDDKFLFVVKFIAQNIHTLKRQLKSTYLKLPWEEMEFVLASFVSCRIKKQEINLFYHSILNKSKLLNYLENFAKKLEDEQNIIESMGIGKVSDLSVERDKVVLEIIKGCPQFEELYNDYQQMRDMSSLAKISTYLKLALSVDPKQREGQLVITRALQVIGECFKHSLESPKLSNTTSELLLQLLPKNTRQIVIDLRNSLSHAHSLLKRTEIEEKADVNFFIGIQNDTKKIDNIISDKIFDNKIKTIRIMLNKIINSENLDEIKEITEIFRNARLDKMIVEDYKMMEHEKLGKLIKELSDSIFDKTYYEKELFNKSNSIINGIKTTAEDFQTNYKGAFLALTSMVIGLDDYFVDQNFIREKNSFANKILNNFGFKIESHSLKQIAELSMNIVRSVTARIQDRDTIEKVYIIICEIFYIVEIGINDLKWIEKLRDQLKKENSFIPKHKQRKVPSMSQEKLNSQITLKLAELKTILKNNALNDNLIQKVPSYKMDKKLQAVVEMLVLDIMVILGGSEDYLENNLLFLDDSTPLLTGKCLRNHLAHENTLVDVLLSDPSIAVLLNAEKLVSENVIKTKKKLGKLVKDEPSKLKGIYDQNLVIIMNQQNMFSSLEEDNFEDFKNHLRKGADIYARSINSQTTLHFAVNGSSLEIIKYILDQNLDVNVKDANGQNPLHIAAAHGRVNIVEFLLTKPEVTVDALDKKHRTSLHYAAKNGHKHIVGILLKNNANTNIKDMFSLSPLHYAIQNNHIDVTKILLKKEVNVDACKSVGGDTLLHWAADGGYLDLAYLLLRNGANVNIKNDKGEIPLHIAALNGHHEVVYALILKGANVNCGAIDGLTPLHYAIDSGYEKAASVLLKHGASVNAVDQIYNKTPLHLAAKGHSKIVKNLLRNNASTNITSVDGLTPLLIASRRGHFEIVADLIEHGANIHAKDVFTNSASLYYAAEGGHKAVVELLIKNGAKINDKANNNTTPLFIAAFKGHNDIVELLIRHKTEIEVQDFNGHTPLHAAVMNGNIETIDLLIKNNAEVNSRNNNGMTPLHVAAQKGLRDVIIFLIKNKAEVNTKDEYGLTPLHVAVLGDHKSIVNLLIENKAEVNAKSIDGFTPLHLAVEAGFIGIVETLVKNKGYVNIETGNTTPLLSAIKLNHKNIVEILIKNGANIDAHNGKPLHLAVTAGNKDIVEILLKNQAFIDIKNSKGFTPLHIAAAKGHKEIVICLINGGANTDVRNFNNTTPLLLAAEGGFEDVIEILISNGAKVNILNIEGAPLHTAAIQGYANVVEILLRNGANVDLKDNLNRTALELAVSYGHLKIVRMLLQHKNMDMNAKGNDDYTLLHIASQENNLEMIKFLVEKGSNINAVNTSGSKPIHIAAREGHKDTVEFFVSKGLSINEPGHECQTLLHYAVMKGGLEVVKYLIAQGAVVNAKDNNGATPMHIAALFGYTDIIEILLNNGAFYNAVDNFFRRPVQTTKNENIINLLVSTEKLFESVKCNSITNAEINIKEGAFVNAKNTYNVTPLHYAAWKGYEEITNLLLQNKANPNTPGKSGCTPIHYAAKFSHLKIVKALLSYGAIYNSLSDGGQTPLDFAVNKNIISLLELISESFKKVQGGDVQVITDLKAIKDIETAKAVMCAHNKENKTLIVSAIHSNFSCIEPLKQILQYDISAQINTGKLLYQQGNYQRALSIFRNAFNRRKEILGVDNPGTLEIQIYIPLTLFKQGMYQDALNMLGDILEKQKQTLGLNNPDTLSTRSLIAMVLHNLGKNEESINIYQEVYEKQKEILGPNDLNTLDTQFNMALVLDKLGEHDEALNINQEMFKTMEKLRGKYDPYTISAKNNIAFVLSNQCKFEESLKIYKEVLDMKKMVLGMNHLDTLRTLSNIARVLSSLNKCDEALEAYQEVLKIQKEVLHQNHPETLSTQNNIANILLAQGKMVSALQMFKECFNPTKTVFGANHPTVLDIVHKIEKIQSLINVEQKLQCPRIRELSQNIHRDIIIAANKGDVQTLQALLKEGANVNYKDVNGITPMHHAVSNGHTDIVNILLKSGADITQVTNKGNTPLHIATSKGYKEIVEILLQHVDCENLNDFVNAKTASGGTTSLHVAAKNGFLEIVGSLLKHGAIYNIENQEGKTPISLSKNQNVINFLKLIEELFENTKKGNFKIFIKLSVIKREDFLAITRARNKQGNTLLQVAIANKHKSIEDKLLKMLEKF